MNRRIRSQHAFTLIELLVVISIIALLVGILLPALASARYQARLISCATQLRQVAIGGHTYLADYDNTFPYGPNNKLWSSKLTDGDYWPSNKEGMYCPLEIWRGTSVARPGWIYAMNRSLIGNYNNFDPAGTFGGRKVTPIKLEFIPDASSANFFSDGTRQGEFYTHYPDFAQGVRFGHPGGPDVYSPPHQRGEHGFGESINYVALDGSTKLMVFDGGELTVAAFKANPNYALNHKKFWGFDQTTKHDAAFQGYGRAPFDP